MHQLPIHRGFALLQYLHFRMMIPLLLKSVLVLPFVALFQSTAQAQQNVIPQQGAVLCAEIQPNVTATSITCDASGAPSLAIALGYDTRASPTMGTAFGMQTHAAGNISTAIGYNTTAEGRSSFTAGANSRTWNDPLVPGGDSAGGAVSMGLDTISRGDWAFSLGKKAFANGYVSAAIGDGTIAQTWGEIALGMYNEINPNLTEAELRNRSVIPVYDEEDPVLRVGVGCSPSYDVGGIGCPEEKRVDALRIYKSGRLYLKNTDGETVEDVLAELKSLRSELEAVKEELAKIKVGTAATSGSLRTAVGGITTMVLLSLWATIVVI